MRRALPFIIAIVAACALASAPIAAADGDPASDILVTQTLFMPWDAGISAQAQAQLAATITAANRAGLRIRVALIDSPADLGAIPALWLKPGPYAKFLGTELSFLYGGQLLVVMPNGFGLYGPDKGASKIGAKEANVHAPTPGHGDHMAQSAITALQLLAAKAGHRFATSPTTVRTAPSPGGGVDWGTWLALALGVLAILAAWAASLKTRPLQRRSRAQA